MSIQLRPMGGGSDALAYAPQRDLRYAYAGAVKTVCGRFNHDTWPELTVYAESRGCTAEELEKANVAYITFLNNSCDNPEAQLSDVLREAGWFDVAVEAQVAYMAMLGTVVTGQFFLALRDTTKLGDKPEDVAKIHKEALDNLYGKTNGESSTPQAVSSS